MTKLQDKIEEILSMLVIDAHSGDVKAMDKDYEDMFELFRKETIKARIDERETCFELVDSCQTHICKLEMINAHKRRIKELEDKIENQP